MRWILLSLLFCGALNASTCILTEEQEFLWNQKYRPLFNVNTEYSDGSYSVEILLPNKIDNREYESSALYIDSLEEPSLFMLAEVSIASPARFISCVKLSADFQREKMQNLKQ